jgi:DNA end-binding protein Ku
MAPRAYWTGYLKLLLVAFPIRMYPAVSSSERIALHQLHKTCKRRIRYQKVCPEHGVLEKEDIVKGYEIAKGRFVVLDDDVLESVQLETTKTIDLAEFVDEDSLDPIYLDSPYYLAPDGPIADEPFRVIREALRRAKKVGIGRLVIAGKEHIVAIRGRDKGLLLTTLRYAAEVRSADSYFDDIKEGKLDDDHLKLAEQLIENKSDDFDPSEYTDRYQAALREAIRARMEGEEPVEAPEPKTTKVVNFMDALKRSLAEASGAEKKTPARKRAARAAQKPARQRKRA